MGDRVSVRRASGKGITTPLSPTPESAVLVLVLVLVLRTVRLTRGTASKIFTKPGLGDDDPPRARGTQQSTTRAEQSKPREVVLKKGVSTTKEPEGTYCVGLGLRVRVNLRLELGLGLGFRVNKGYGSIQVRVTVTVRVT